MSTKSACHIIYLNFTGPHTSSTSSRNWTCVNPNHVWCWRAHTNCRRHTPIVSIIRMCVYMSDVCVCIRHIHTDVQYTKHESWIVSSGLKGRIWICEIGVNCTKSTARFATELIFRTVMMKLCEISKFGCIYTCTCTRLAHGSAFSQIYSGSLDNCLK